MANFSAGSADVEIGPNFTNFVRELRAELDLVEASLGVEIKPDFSGFAEELRTELERYDVKLEIEVGVDQVSLNELQALIEAHLALMDLRVDVKVGADTRVAADELAVLKAAYREMTMRVDADTSTAAAQIGALNNTPVTANVRAKVDRGGLLSGLLSEPLLLNVGALGLAQLPAVATAVATIGADIQSLVQGATLLPGIFAAAGAGITTLSIGLDGMKDAFGEGKKAQQAYEGMSASGRRLVDTIKAAGPEWDRIGARIQTITLDGLSKPMDHLLKTQMPALDRGMGAVAGSMNRQFGTLLTELASDKSVGTVDRVFGNTAKSADILNGAIKPIISSIETLAGTGSDKLPRLAQGFTDAATKFDSFLTRADQSGDLSRWMNEAIDAGKNLVSVVGNVGSMLASVFRASKGDGDGFLVTVDRVTERWATWLKSSEGQAELRSFFREGREQMDQWLPILQNVGSVLKTVFEASQAWSAILMPFLRAGSELLGEHDGILKTVLVSYLAFRTVGPILTMVQNGIAGMSTRMVQFQSGMANASAGGAGALGKTLGGLGAMLGPGGLVTLGIIGASALIGVMATKHQEAADAAERQRVKLDQLRETLDAQTGSVTEETITSVTKDLESRGFLERAETLGVDPKAYVEAGIGLDPAAKAQINERLTQIILEQYGTNENSKMSFDQVAQTLHLSNTDVAQALQGIPEAVARFDEAWAKHGNGSLQDLADLKGLLNDIGESAVTLGGEMNGLGTNTAQAGEAARRMNETMTGTFQLTEQGKAAFQELGLTVIGVPNEKTIQVKSTTPEQQTALEHLGYTVTHMKDGTVKIILDDAGAKASIAEITKPAVKPITAVMNFDGDYSKPEGARQPIPRADGGPITGGVPGLDSVPILGMPGEHMLTTSDVDKLGGQAGVYRFRAALQAGLVRPMKSGGAVKPWDEGDDIDLAQAQNAVAEAQEKLRALDFEKNVPASKRRKAELAVQEAQYKVQQLEDRKAGRTGSGPAAEILPQAELPGRRSNADLDKEDADAAVDQANTKRNKVYNDANSTDEQKREADRAYQRAQNARAEAYKSKGTGTDGDVPEISLPGIAASAAGILAEGFLSALGLENSILSGNNVYTRSLNKVIGFYGNKAKEDGQPDVGDGYDYTPKNLPQERESESASSSSSSSGAEGTKSGEEYDASGGVEQWRGTFSSVLRALSMPSSWLELGLAQMKSESGGNPKAINLWDSNASKGTPSKGLMQVIDPTFASNRSTLYPNDIWDPGANIAASLRYTVGRYGSPVGVWGQGHGYRDGGWAFGPGGPRDDAFLAPLSNGEFVVNAAAAALNAPALEAMNAGLPLPVSPLPAGMTPRGGDTSTVNRDHGVHFHAPVSVMDMGELMREQDRWSALQAQGAMAGLPR